MEMEVFDKLEANKASMCYVEVCDFKRFRRSDNNST